jgi:quercetin dioxygenase-like cupin family protein
VELQPVNPTVKMPASWFTGDVHMTPVYSPTEPSRMNVALVRFTPGAHTHWHSHAVGQTLHVTEGRLGGAHPRRRDRHLPAR